MQPARLHPQATTDSQVMLTRGHRAAKWQDVPDAQWFDWKWQLKNRINTVPELEEVLTLTESERAGASAEGIFRLDITPYFASLMHPTDPTCPVRRQVIPTHHELEPFMSMMEDSLAEDKHSPVPGLVHRYPDRVLMLVTTQCASYCRYCTRSRIVGDPTETFNPAEFEAQLDYLRHTPQVRDVLLSGGDPLTLAPKVLGRLLSELRAIPHIEIIRIGTRVPVFMPMRVTDELCQVLSDHHPLWMNIHINHPKEITPEVADACDKLTRAGIPLGNQSVLLRGVNDHPVIMQKLLRELVKILGAALLHLPVRPRARRGPPAHHRQQGAGDHGEPARAHVGLQHPDLRRGRARRRRQDSGRAELRAVAQPRQADSAQLRGLHRRLHRTQRLCGAGYGCACRLAALGAWSERYLRLDGRRAPQHRAGRIQRHPPPPRRGESPPEQPRRTSGPLTAWARRSISDTAPDGQVSTPVPVHSGD